MKYTDCFAYRNTYCSALHTMVCDKSPYCSFYKKESENCNRTVIKTQVDNYSSPKALKGGVKRRYEKANNKPTTISETGTPNT